MSLSRSQLSHRFFDRRTKPRLVRLARALGRLKSTVTVLHTGAHPDDEQNGMLAYLRFGLGMRTIIGCSTRGEGGQNALGPERGAALGVIRTRELEEAARVIDSDIVWFGMGPADPVHDFGFSKDGTDTLSRWGHEVILERLVRAYRSEKPDIVIPTFLDVPGQHGHHRAMTMAAEEAVALAADPQAFPDHFGQGLRPWRVAKFYLPAWPGGGATYDDELPPPPMTTAITLTDRDLATGASFDEIGEWSRLFHASQGMGVWPETPQTQWPLHLLIGSPDSEGFADGLPRRLADIAPKLSPADIAIAEAIAAYPDPEKVIAALLRALDAIDACENVPQEHEHRIQSMRDDLDAALFEAAGIDCVATLATPLLPQGESTELAFTLFGVPEDHRVELILPEGVSATARGPGRFTLAATPDAPLTDPFVSSWAASGERDVAQIVVTATIAGRVVSRPFPLERALRVVPAVSAALSPSALIVPANAPFAGLLVDCTLSDGRKPQISAPGTIAVSDAGKAFSLSGTGLDEGRYDLTVEVGGHRAFAAETIDYAHIGRTVHLDPASISVLALELSLPEDRRVAYIGGGADRTAVWLSRMGFEVTVFDAGELGEDLLSFPAIVVGIFAFGLRPDLREKSRMLRDYVEGGGNLVTLYHRPWDGWDPKEVPPRPLTIGQPSLRWRVTNPDAQVDILAPDHPLVRGPNRITQADFGGWNKERGLYFASDWDPAYVPLLAMSDAGEPPLEGGLLTARIGTGRHTHTSLVLHHQLDHLVPGAFRILANLVAGGRM